MVLFFTAEGMPGENIKNDLHIYKFSLEKIKERIDRAKEVGIESLKPWIIRCPPESFDKYVADILYY